MNVPITSVDQLKWIKKLFSVIGLELKKGIKKCVDRRYFCELVNDDTILIVFTEDRAGKVCYYDAKDNRFEDRQFARLSELYTHLRTLNMKYVSTYTRLRLDAIKAARTWVTNNTQNGVLLPFGSDQIIYPLFTMKKIDELAAFIASEHERLDTYRKNVEKGRS